MNQRADNIVEVTVEEVKDSAPGSVAGQSSVVIQTESTVDGKLRDTSIEVRDADAPSLAAALLNAEVGPPPADDDLPTAVQCLAAGVMHSASAGQVRLHLQFESGQVLPIEMPHAAAAALSRALSAFSEHTDGAFSDHTDRALGEHTDGALAPARPHASGSVQNKK